MNTEKATKGWILDVYENENDAKRNKAKLVYYFSKELIE